MPIEGSRMLLAARAFVCCPDSPTGGVAIKNPIWTLKEIQTSKTIEKRKKRKFEK